MHGHHDPQQSFHAGIYDLVIPDLLPKVIPVVMWYSEQGWLLSAPRKKETTALAGNTERNGAQDRVASQAIQFNTGNSG